MSFSQLSAADDCHVGSDEVPALLRHRPPFLFVDSGKVNNERTKAWAVHSFLPEESYFEGHFPDDPIVPGVVLLEFIAQTANLLLSVRAGDLVQSYLVGVDEARFNRTVKPGESVTSEVRFAHPEAITRQGSAERFIDFKASLFVGTKRCARASIKLYRNE